jgi:DNA-directed RNA polymerase sigma subunit (sigma70/sigma32)
MRLHTSGDTRYQPTSEDFAAARTGDHHAVTRIVDSVVKLVKAKAAKFLDFNLPAHIELDDLIQEGNKAVVTAVPYFDPARGYKWNTYAGTCAWRAMSNFIKSRHVQPIGEQEAEEERPMESIPAKTPEPPEDGAAHRLAQMLLKLNTPLRIAIRKKKGLLGEKERTYDQLSDDLTAMLDRPIDRRQAESLVIAAEICLKEVAGEW